MIYLKTVSHSFLQLYNISLASYPIIYLTWARGDPLWPTAWYLTCSDKHNLLGPCWWCYTHTHPAWSLGANGMLNPRLPKCPDSPHNPATLADTSKALPALSVLHITKSPRATQLLESTSIDPGPIHSGHGRGIRPLCTPNIPQGTYHSYLNPHSHCSYAPQRSICIVSQLHASRNFQRHCQVQCLPHRINLKGFNSCEFAAWTPCLRPKKKKKRA